MPLLGLPVFWLTPLNLALPIYIVLVLISGLLYWLIWRSMKVPLKTGPDSLIGTEAEVVSKVSLGHLAQYLVRTRGELWSACCSDVLQSGETVNITDLNGINLIVKPGNISSDHHQSSGINEGETRGREWCCH